MPNFKKETFYILLNKEGDFKVEAKNGYTDGRWNYYKSWKQFNQDRPMDEGVWCAVDPATGAAVVYGQTLIGTKIRACSKATKRKFDKIIKMQKYKDFVRIFEGLKNKTKEN